MEVMIFFLIRIHQAAVEIFHKTSLEYRFGVMGASWMMGNPGQHDVMTIPDHKVVQDPSGAQFKLWVHETLLCQNIADLSLIHWIPV